MKKRTCLEKLAKIVTPVKEGDEGFKEWSEQSMFFAFLAEQREETSIVLYASSFDHGSLLLKTILVPIGDLEHATPDSLTRWDDPLESWSCGLVYGGGQAARVEYSTPLSRIQPEAFKHGERLVFPRSFDGRKEDKEYYEIAQSLSHAHGLHWTPEKQAWCQLDDNLPEGVVGRSASHDTLCHRPPKCQKVAQDYASGTDIPTRYPCSIAFDTFCERHPEGCTMGSDWPCWLRSIGAKPI